MRKKKYRINLSNSIFADYMEKKLLYVDKIKKYLGKASKKKPAYAISVDVHKNDAEVVCKMAWWIFQKFSTEALLSK